MCHGIVDTWVENLSDIKLVRDVSASHAPSDARCHVNTDKGQRSFEHLSVENA